MSKTTSDSESQAPHSTAELNSFELEKQYNPGAVENKIYNLWLQNKCFKSEDVSKKPPYAIILPPPNVTGFLHLGHALDHTIQDILVRWKRMSGYNAVWVPGTDHAGISTQSVVEKNLSEQGILRTELGREKFEAKVWEWKKIYGDRIVNQMQRLGNSCDWDRLTFTLDEGVSKAVRKVFVNLYSRKLIYKGKKLVNWSTKLETAISDIEVDYKEVKGKLYHLSYPLKNGSGALIVATTRPETMLGDSAVAVHPQDERYKNWIGQKIILPITGREIPIIADEYVDQEFGSGAVKITPAHDFNDYEMGLRHKLEFINIMNSNGTVVEGYKEFSGLKMQEARKKIVEALEASGVLVKIENHTHSIGHCSKTGTVAEPYLSEQWFLKMSELSKPAIKAVENGTTKFIPESWTKTYMHWMHNIQDWCISRQLWWGHRIPVWTCQDCSHTNVSETDVSVCAKCGSKNLNQESDVLDTWFSSALWPFSILGWPENTESLKTFYPTDVLVTGHDIIFFWVARMMMQGLEFNKDIPFRDVYIHGLIRDSQGRKMSKSLGNSVDPVEMIDQVGADALRGALISQLNTGKDIKFSDQRLELYRNFMNKIWNATRFALGSADVDSLKNYKFDDVKSKTEISIFDQWIIYKIGEVIKSVDENLKAYRFSDAINELYSFLWNDFCDWYLEFSKATLYNKEADAVKERAATSLVLFQTLGRALKMLHPFIPFITEAIYDKFPLKDSEFMCLAPFPNPKNNKEWLSMGTVESWEEVELIKQVITAIRNIRGENSIALGLNIAAFVVPQDERSQKILTHHKALLVKFCKLSELHFEDRKSRSKCAVTPVQFKGFSVDVVIPLEGLVDIDEEIKRLQKNIEKVKKDINILTQKLNNENYIKNAQEDLVENDKNLLKESESKFRTLQDSLNRLSL
jgi:valyl-tRNA synthetase